MKLFVSIQKWFASILACLQLLFCGVVYGELQPSAPKEEPQENIVNSIEGDSNLSDSVQYAARAKNAVQAVFTDASRSRYEMRNADVSLTHNLEVPGNATATLRGKNGGVYLADTLDPFYTTTSGASYYASASVDTARPNTIRLGEYYYESHIRDLRFAKNSNGQFWVDKAYHLYSDRLYQELILMASSATTALASFGLETKIPVSAVAAIQLRDAGGIKTSPEGMEEATVEYAAFDIRDVGVVGFIIPSDGSTASVSIRSDGTNYIITQKANFTPGTGINKNDESGGYALNSVRFGNRIYTDSTHTFNGIDKEAYLERHPLQDLRVTGGNAAGEYLGYEHLRGSYQFTMQGTDFAAAYANPDIQYAAPITIAGDSRNRDIYIHMSGKSGCLEAGALLDDSGTLAAMDVQVCKNFQGDGGEPFYSVKDYMYGDSFFPIRLKANETQRFTLLNMYQNWGKYPLKQLSSIEFHVSYYHLSTGATESNCIAPYFVYGKDGWTLPDFRGCSGDIWKDQPQFNSVGQLYFPKYTKNLKEIGSEYTGSTINASGLSYADIEYTYRSDCGSYDYTLRHVEFPQTDENRTYYEIDLSFNRDVSLRNLKEDFSLFSFDGRFVNFDKAEYLDENNTPQTKTLPNSFLPALDDYIILGKEQPYFGYYDISDKSVKEQTGKNFGANFGLIVKNSAITVDGKAWNGNLCIKNSYDGKLNTAALTLNEKKLEFKAGDTIHLELILLPWGRLSEPENGTVQKVREDSALHPLTAQSSVGTVIPDAYLPIIQSDNNIAQFTLKGGRGNQAVRINGFTENRCPTVYRSSGSGWEPVSLASGNGYDGYTVYYDKLTGLYDFSFVYTAENPQTEYRFRCVQE